MAVRLPADPDFIRQRKPPKRDQVMPTARVIRKPPPMPPRPLPQSRARNMVPEPLVQMTREMIRAQGFVEPRLVADFQQANGLKIDGVIGPKTMNAALRGGGDAAVLPSQSAAIRTFGELKPVEPGWYETYFINPLTRMLGDDRRARQTVESFLPIVETAPGIGEAAGLAQAVDLYEEGHPLLAAGAGGLALSGAIVPPIKALTGPATRALQRFAREGAAAVGNAEQTAKETMLREFPTTLQRPYAADYPSGSASRTGEPVRFGMEGGDLTNIDPSRISGRRMEGGPDEAISPSEYDAMTAEAVGGPASDAPRSFTKGHGMTGIDATKKPTWIYLADDLSSYERVLVYGHELGHVVDQLAGEIETSDELLAQLHRVYTAGRTGVDRESNFLSPVEFGYEDDNVTRELWAEAIRAYITNPNYIKTVAPEAAAAIRRVANSDPIISKIVRFNSIAAGSLAAGAAAGALQEDTGDRQQ